MNALDSMATCRAVSYRCSSCSRCFVALDEGVAGQIVCVCGAPLSPVPLPRGIYEIRSPVPVDARVTNPGPAPQVLDGGYAASHGYGPSHGGPTGPSDAPAAAPASSRASG